MKLTLLFAEFYIVLSGCFFDLILGSLEDLEENDTIKIIEKNGYPAESHFIETEDGYLLQLQRIRHGRNSTGTSSKQPFLFLHGIFTSSNAYLAMGLNSLPFLLADRGYDVWLGNFRGTQYSRFHRTLSPKSSEYWNFSCSIQLSFLFHEVGLYDLPAKLDYICNYTRRNNVILLGHSFGNTVQMVMAITRPEYQKKVRASVLIAAPSIFHMEKKLVRALAPIYPLVYSKSFINRELSGQRPMVQATLKSLGFVGKEDLWMHLLSLKNTIQEYNEMAYFSSNFYSSSTSWKVLAHYFQFAFSGKIRQYDYGPSENLIRYKSPEPPTYNLESITIPMALVFAPNDVFGCKEDAEYLLKRMKNIKKVLNVEDKKFSHLNFQHGANIKELVYNKLLKIIEDLEKL